MGWASPPFKDGQTVVKTLDSSLNQGVFETITPSDDGVLEVSWDAGVVYTSAGDFVATDAGSGTATDNTTTYLYWATGTTLTLSTVPPSLDEVSVGHFDAQAGDIWEVHT